MAYSYDQARTALADLVKGSYSLDDLLNLAKQVNVTANGSITVLYSKMGDLPGEMATDPNIRILDKTDGFKFLTSNAFMDALGDKVGLTLDEMQDKKPLIDPVKQALKPGRVGKRLFACPPICQRCVEIPRGQTMEPFAHPTRLEGSGPPARRRKGPRLGKTTKPHNRA